MSGLQDPDPRIYYLEMNLTFLVRSNFETDELVNKKMRLL